MISSYTKSCCSKISRIYLLINWKKNQQWKKVKLYSTIQEQHLHNPLSHVVSSNILITNHSRAGELEVARNIFDKMPERTVVTFNTMISGYSKWGKFEESLDVASGMHRSGMKLNETTFSCLLSVCARIRSLCDGKQIHSVVFKSGSENFELVGSSLLNFYATCYEIVEAKKVFDELHERNDMLWSLMVVGLVQCGSMKDAMDVLMRMPARDVISWTALISGYSRSEGEFEKGWELLQLMTKEGEASPNEFTLDSVLRACGRLGVLSRGKIVHGITVKYGFESDNSVGGALIEFYSNCDVFEDAKKVHVTLTNPCLNSSNSLIGGLVSIGRIDEAEMVFNGMVEKNTASYNLMIKGYAMSCRVGDSKRLFEEMPQRTIATSNTMISVYSRNGEIDKALKLFEQTKGERNTVTWNSMISAFTHCNTPEKALTLYIAMHRLQVEHNRSTFSTLFHACSCLGSLQQGKLLHSHVIKTPFESNVYVGTSLVDMYSKCGSISDAQTTFTSICSPNVAAWTSLINGYAHHGLGAEAILLFNQMIDRGVNPNAVTFTGLLSVCARVGLVSEGMEYFYSMKKKYGILPSVEHYACLVDLLGKSGYLQEAEELIIGMPFEADCVIWGALLSACWSWMNMEIGERVAEKMFSLDPKQIYAYVIMSNIYAGVGKWGEVMKVRKKLRNMEVKKDPGCSWLEVNNRVHVFSVEDRSHPNCKEIYVILAAVTSNINFILEFDDDLHHCQELGMIGEVE